MEGRSSRLSRRESKRSFASELVLDEKLKERSEKVLADEKAKRWNHRKSKKRTYWVCYHFVDCCFDNQGTNNHFTSYSFTPFCNSTSVLFLNFATSLMDRDNRTDNREDGVMYADEFLNVGFCVGTVVEPYTGCVPTLSCKQQPCNPKTIAKKSHFQSEES